MNYRKHFSDQLVGFGLDIGALNNPLFPETPWNIDYVDRMSVAELRKQYPELANLDLVEPNIIDDAETLNTIGNEAYDFVIVSHVIEHMRNPLKALETWMRVLKPKGLLYLVVPDYRKIFDQYRELTTLEHIIADYETPDIEIDYDHYLDYAKNVNIRFFKRDLDMIEEARNLSDQDYSIHFHTFTPESVTRILSYFSENIVPSNLLEGPLEDPIGIEFHMLVQKV